jgi:sugar lactone lactonase YvrE
MGEGFTGALYRLDPDGSVHTAETGIGISNGIGWSPDNTIMYYTDSLSRTIYAYDYDAATGNISNRRDLIVTPEDDGLPDGLTIDGDGYIWSACWGGWKVTRYAPDGRIDREVRLPAAQITACVFGGPNLDELYITSAWTELDAEQRRSQPLAGDVFRLKTDVRGLAEPHFAG